MIAIYSVEICPFAQRTRALLTHLGQPFGRTVDLENRDPEFLKLTPTGKVPLLVEGDLRLCEAPDLVDSRPALRQWLDRTVALAAIRKTLPDRDLAVRRYEERYVCATDASRSSPRS